MSRILFAWELGANYGHLTRMAPIAERLRSAGHQVFFAVRDVASAAEILGPKGFAFAQAPVPSARPRPKSGPGNNAEMLALEGYADRVTLWGMARGWISLAQLFRTDLVVADHAPGALLAARILGLPRAQIGSGFEIPPSGSPLPAIRPWEDISEERLRRSEQGVTDVVNAVIRSFRGKELENIAGLFDSDARVLSTFAELDPFGPRAGERYVGAIYDAKLGDPAVWPEDGRPRIFAYLRPGVPGAENILQALSTVKATTLCVMPEIRPETAGKLGSDRLRIAPRPLQLASVLSQADLVLTYGGHGIVGAALVAGVPLLIAPGNVEQFLHAKRVEALGAGAIVGNDRSAASVASLVEKALADGKLSAAARAFAESHKGFEPAQAVE